MAGRRHPETPPRPSVIKQLVEVVFKVVTCFQSILAAVIGEGEGPAKELPDIPPEPSLKKELFKVFLRELALIQSHIVVLILMAQRSPPTDLDIQLFYPVVVLMALMGSWKNLLYGMLKNILEEYHVLGYHVFFITVITLVLLFVLDCFLTTTTNICKQTVALSDDEKRMLKMGKTFIRWLGHLLLVLLASNSILKLMQQNKTEAYFDDCYLFLTIGIVAKILIDAITIVPVEMIRNVGKIPLKWIVTLELAYLPSIVYIVWSHVLSRDEYKNFSLTVSLAEAVILTMCTADYKEMKQRHGLKNILGAVKVGLAGVLLHCYSHGGDWTGLATGGLKGIVMWAAHFTMSKF